MSEELMTVRELAKVSHFNERESYACFERGVGSCTA
jgi:hypothetical protein